MIREVFTKGYFGKQNGFRYRGVEPGRLENFSDAVFALAVTLLLISTSAPSSFLQVKRFVFEVIPFILNIALIIVIWHEHFQFYLRYGLRNGRMVAINSVFLVIVLFYVYPLKFLTRLILIPIGYMLDKDWLVAEMFGLIRPQDVGDLMIIYGLGATAVFWVLMYMYRTALRSADVLQLSEIEIFDTRTSIRTNLLMGAIPLISVVVALIFRGSQWAGLFSGLAYFLYTPVMFIHGHRVDRRRKKLLETTIPEADPPQELDKTSVSDHSHLQDQAS